MLSTKPPSLERSFTEIVNGKALLTETQSPLDLKCLVEILFSNFVRKEDGSIHDAPLLACQTQHLQQAHEMLTNLSSAIAEVNELLQHKAELPPARTISQILTKSRVVKSMLDKVPDLLTLEGTALKQVCAELDPDDAKVLIEASQVAKDYPVYLEKYRQNKETELPTINNVIAEKFQHKSALVRILLEIILTHPEYLQDDQVKLIVPRPQIITKRSEIQSRENTFYLTDNLNLPNDLKMDATVPQTTPIIYGDVCANFLAQALKYIAQKNPAAVLNTEEDPWKIVFDYFTANVFPVTFFHKQKLTLHSDDIMYGERSSSLPLELLISWFSTGTQGLMAYLNYLSHTNSKSLVLNVSVKNIMLRLYERQNIIYFAHNKHQQNFFLKDDWLNLTDANQLLRNYTDKLRMFEELELELTLEDTLKDSAHEFVNQILIMLAWVKEHQSHLKRFKIKFHNTTDVIKLPELEYKRILQYLTEHQITTEFLIDNNISVIRSDNSKLHHQQYTIGATCLNNRKTPPLQHKESPIRQQTRDQVKLRPVERDTPAHWELPRNVENITSNATTYKFQNRSTQNQTGKLQTAEKSKSDQKSQQRVRNNVVSRLHAMPASLLNANNYKTLTQKLALSPVVGKQDKHILQKCWQAVVGRESYFTHVTPSAFQVILATPEAFLSGLDMAKLPPGFYVDKKIVIENDVKKEVVALDYSLVDVTTTDTPTPYDASLKPITSHHIESGVNIAYIVEEFLEYKSYLIEQVAEPDRKELLSAIFAEREKIYERNSVTLPEYKDQFLKFIYPPNGIESCRSPKLKSFLKTYLTGDELINFRKLLLREMGDVKLIQQLLEKLANFQGKNWQVFYYSFLQDLTDYSHLATPEALDYLDKISKLSPEEMNWWNTLIKQQTAANYVSADWFKASDFIITARAFFEFLKDLKTISDAEIKLPYNCNVKDCYYLPVALKRLIFILKQSNDPHLQIQQTFSLSAEGAEYAMQHFGYHFVCEEMQFFTQMNLFETRRGLLESNIKAHRNGPHGMPPNLLQEHNANDYFIDDAKLLKLCDSANIMSYIFRYWASQTKQFSLTECRSFANDLTAMQERLHKKSIPQHIIQKLTVSIAIMTTRLDGLNVKPTHLVTQLIEYLPGCPISPEHLLKICEKALSDPKIGLSELFAVIERLYAFIPIEELGSLNLSYLVSLHYNQTISNAYTVYQKINQVKFEEWMYPIIPLFNFSNSNANDLSWISRDLMELRHSWGGFFHDFLQVLNQVDRMKMQSNHYLDDRIHQVKACFDGLIDIKTELTPEIVQAAIKSAFVEVYPGLVFNDASMIRNERIVAKEIQFKEDAQFNRRVDQLNDIVDHYNDRNKSNFPRFSCTTIYHAKSMIDYMDHYLNDINALEHSSFKSKILTKSSGIQHAFAQSLSRSCRKELLNLTGHICAGLTHEEQTKFKVQISSLLETLYFPSPAEFKARAQNYFDQRYAPIRDFLIHMRLIQQALGSGSDFQYLLSDMLQDIARINVAAKRECFDSYHYILKQPEFSSKEKSQLMELFSRHMSQNSEVKNSRNQIVDSAKALIVTLKRLGPHHQLRESLFKAMACGFSRINELDTLLSQHYTSPGFIKLLQNLLDVCATKPNLIVDVLQCAAGNQGGLHEERIAVLRHLLRTEVGNDFEQSIHHIVHLFSDESFLAKSPELSRRYSQLEKPLPLNEMLLDRTDSELIIYADANPYGPRNLIQQIGLDEDSEKHLAEQIKKIKLLIPHHFPVDEGIGDQANTLTKIMRVIKRVSNEVAAETTENLLHQLRSLSNNDADLAKRLAILRELYYRKADDGVYLNQTQMLALLCRLIYPGATVMSLATGEGKGAIAAIEAATRALQGKTVDYYSYNHSLVKRDYNNAKHFFDTLAIRTAFIEEGASANCYLNGPGCVNFSESSTMALFRLEHSSDADIIPVESQRYAIFDEIDHLAINHVTSFVLSNSDKTRDGFYSHEGEAIYGIVNDFVDYLQLSRLKYSSLTATEKNRVKELAKMFKHVKPSTIKEEVRALESYLFESNLFRQALPSQVRLNELITSAYTAKKILQNKSEFIVKPVAVKIRGVVAHYNMPIITENGVPQYDSRWANGVHQLLTARLNRQHQAEITNKTMLPFLFEREIKPQGVMTADNLIDFYDDNFTGYTATPGQNKALQQYKGASVIAMPTHFESRLKIEEDIIPVDKEAYFNSIITKLMQHNDQPCLILCANVEEVRELQSYLRRHIKDRPLLSLTGDNAEETTAVLKQAALKNTITISNMVERGHDIKIKQNALFLACRAYRDAMISLQANPGKNKPEYIDSVVNELKKQLAQFLSPENLRKQPELDQKTVQQARQLQKILSSPSDRDKLPLVELLMTKLERKLVEIYTQVDDPKIEKQAIRTARYGQAGIFVRIVNPDAVKAELGTESSDESIPSIQKKRADHITDQRKLNDIYGRNIAHIENYFDVIIKNVVAQHKAGQIDNSQSDTDPKMLILAVKEEMLKEIEQKWAELIEKYSQKSFGHRKGFYRVLESDFQQFILEKGTEIQASIKVAPPFSMPQKSKATLPADDAITVSKDKSQCMRLFSDNACGFNLALSKAAKGKAYFKRIISNGYQNLANPTYLEAARKALLNYKSSIYFNRHRKDQVDDILNCNDSISLIVNINRALITWYKNEKLAPSKLRSLLLRIKKTYYKNDSLDSIGANLAEEYRILAACLEQLQKEKPHPKTQCIIEEILLQLSNQASNGVDHSLLLFKLRQLMRANMSSKQEQVIKETVKYTEWLIIAYRAIDSQQQGPQKIAQEIELKLQHQLDFKQSLTSCFFNRTKTTDVPLTSLPQTMKHVAKHLNSAERKRLLSHLNAVRDVLARYCALDDMEFNLSIDDKQATLSVNYHYYPTPNGAAQVDMQRCKFEISIDLESQAACVKRNVANDRLQV